MLAILVAVGAVPVSEWVAAGGRQRIMAILLAVNPLGCAPDRFGSGGIPVVSRHNALWGMSAPPADAEVVVLVGGQADDTARWFGSCRTVDELDNGVGVQNEEQGQPIMVCQDPRKPWSQLWDEFSHLG